MIRNRNQKRGRHDDQDMGGDIDIGANPANIEDANDSDEEQGGGWASDDDEPTKGTGNARVGDDNVEVKTKDGKIPIKSMNTIIVMTRTLVKTEYSVMTRTAKESITTLFL